MPQASYGYPDLDYQQPRRRAANLYPSPSPQNGPLFAGVGSAGQTPLMPQQPQQDPETAMRQRNMGILPRGPSPQSNAAVAQRRQDQQFTQDANTRANMLAQSAMLPQASRAQSFRPPDPKQRSTAFHNYFESGMTDPAQINAQLDKDFAAPATQPSAPLPTGTPNSFAGGMLPTPGQVQPAMAMPQAPTPRAPTAPATGQNQMTEQHARFMLQSMAQNYPNMMLGDLKPMWSQTLGAHGIAPQQADALWNKWHQEGSLGKFDYQTGPMQPAHTRVDAAPNAQQNVGGLATLPNGQQIALNPQGMRVGGALSQGSPLPMTPSAGPQPGYSPINQMLPMGSPSMASGGSLPPTGRGMGNFRVGEAMQQQMNTPPLMPGTASAQLAGGSSYPSVGNPPSPLYQNGVAARQPSPQTQARTQQLQQRAPTTQMVTNQGVYGQMDRPQLGNGQVQPPPSVVPVKKRVAVRTGTYNGQRVAQFNDGSIELQ